MTAGLKRQQRELQQQLDALDDAMAGEGDALTEQELLRVRESRAELQQRLEQVSGRIARMPFLDEFDIHYRRHEKVPVPRSRAVMFCLMDVSGSMDQRTKDLAKRFFILLYLFLSRNYDKVELVFIRHHTRAIEVD